MKVFYVQWSSWFDSHKYNIKEMMTAIRLGGGKNIRLEKQFGWNNQPEVVVFEWKTDDDFEQIKHNLVEAVGTEWLLIHKKTWQTHKVIQ